MTDNRLGEFLRARRELTRPEEKGLPDLGRRRVPGLRREEVAMLAGISAEYYVRLERGRDRHPSGPVVAALARVLDLDADSAAYLAALAAERPAVPARTDVEEPRPAVLRMLASMPGVPAFVVNRWMDVLASNPLAVALHGGELAAGVGSSNMVRHVFLDPHARELYPDWDDVAAESVATLRGSVGTELDHPRLVGLVGELSVRSPEFARLWARQEVRNKTAGTKHLISPALGDVVLSWESLSVTSAPGQLVVTYFAEPGTATADRLAALATSLADRP
jgi:transcriptional regulator with XRE-family HTH domain